MLFLLIPSLFSIHAALFTSHIHLHTHIVLIVVILVLSIIRTIRALATSNASTICAFTSPSSCAAHNTCCVSVALPPGFLLPASAVGNRCCGYTIDGW
jgi:hypothetical protein